MEINFSPVVWAEGEQMQSAFVTLSRKAEPSRKKRGSDFTSRLNESSITRAFHKEKMLCGLWNGCLWIRAHVG